MKRLIYPVLLLGLAAFPALRAQASAETAASSEKGEGSLKGWEWANFVILAAGLGYLAGKRGGPFFSARSRQISKDIADAAELRKQAEERAAEVERRLAGIESCIAALREEAQNEARAAAAKAARADLKRHSAELAVDLAERLIRERMTPDAQDELVREFIRHLEDPAGPESGRN